MAKTMTDALPVDAPPGPGDTFIELRGGVPYIGTQAGKARGKPLNPDGPEGDHDFLASLDVTDVLTVAASDHFNPDELRDPKTGKWVRDPAGRFLDEAAKSLGYQERISHKGHSIDRTKAGFTVKLKSGEKHSYEHAGDAAEAVRRGRHLNDTELRHAEGHLPGAGKPEPPEVKEPKLPDEMARRNNERVKPEVKPAGGGIKWTADGASYHQGTDAAGNKYVLKYAPGGGWDVHEQPKGAAHGRVLGEKIGHGKNAAEAKAIAEAHTAGGSKPKTEAPLVLDRRFAAETLAQVNRDYGGDTQGWQKDVAAGRTKRISVPVEKVRLLQEPFPGKVSEYSDRLGRGEDVGRPVVVKSGGLYLLLDGNHKAAAQVKGGATHLDVELVTPGVRKVEPPKPELPKQDDRAAEIESRFNVLQKKSKADLLSIAKGKGGVADLAGADKQSLISHILQSEYGRKGVADWSQNRGRKPEPPKPQVRRNPKPDPVQGLSGKSRDGKASPLEREFFLEHHDHSGRTTGFTVYDRGEPDTAANLEMYRAVPQEMRQQLAANGAEIYMGTRPVTEMDDLHNLATSQPSGYSKDQTFAKVAAMVSVRATPGNRDPHPVVAIGGGDRTYGSGSVNVSAHEAAHALDSTSSQPSQSPEFQRLYKSVKGNFTISPYYVQRGNAAQGAREFFAEAFAAWAVNRDDKGQRGALIMRSVGARGDGYRKTGDPLDALKAEGDKLAAYFDEFYQSFIKEGQ